MPAGTIIFREGLVEPRASARTVSLARSSDALNELGLLWLRHGRDIRNAVFALEISDYEQVNKEDMAKKPHAGEYPLGLLTDWLRMYQRRAAVALRGASRSVEPKRTMADLFSPLEPTPIWTPPYGRKHGLYRGGFVHVGMSNPEEQKVRLHVLKPSFSVLTVAPLSDRQLLIATCGRCENTGMKFSEDRRTVGRHWGGSPVMIEPVTLEWDFRYEGEWRCRALGPDGRPTAEVPFDDQGAEGSRILRLGPKYKTMWYLLTRK